MGYSSNKSNNSNRNNGNRNNRLKKQNGQSNSQQKKARLNARNEKGKYSDDEIARAKYLDSMAKFIVRDRISNDNIDTKGKWIDVTNIEYEERYDNRGRFKPKMVSFDVEIFDKTQVPVYDDNMSEDEKHQLTYEVAEEDIEKQKSLERRKHKKVDRPSYHVDVAAKTNRDHKTEYYIKGIKEKGKKR